MRSNRLGFTLIELLVVIAIIAILAAILFPVFIAAKQRSQMIGCVNNLKQLSTAMMNYAADNGGRMPSVAKERLDGTDNYAGCMGTSRWVYPEKGQIWDYVRNKAVYKCKADKGKTPGWIADFWVPPGMKKSDYPLSYSMNETVSQQMVDTLRGLYGKRSKYLLLIHENPINIQDTVFGGRANYDQDIPCDVHYEGSCVSYIDGHARYGSFKDLKAEKDAGYWDPEDWIRNHVK